MSELIVLNILHSIPPVREFIKTRLSDCDKPNCLPLLIKNLFLMHSMVGFRDLSAYSSLYQKKSYTNYSFFESLSMVLQEFHSHEIKHCQKTEFSCLYHNLFTSICRSCPDKTFSELFPTVWLDAIPEIRKLSPDDKETYAVYQKFFDFNKKFALKCVGGPQSYKADKEAQCVIFSIRGEKQIKLANALSSFPCSINFTKFLEFKFEHDHQLIGIILSDSTNIFYFHTENTIKTWTLLSSTMKETSSFVELSKTMINTKMVPIGLVYSLQKSTGNLESYYFSHLESIETVNEPQQLSNSWAVNEEFLWSCHNCRKIVQGLICQCGSEKEVDEWRCYCGEYAQSDVCRCGRQKPKCKYCKAQCEDIEKDCRRCGGGFVKGICEVCEFCVIDVCSHCYEGMESCEICGYFNVRHAIACRRCMNPSFRIMNI